MNFYHIHQAEQDYMTTQQGEHELITKFKERFDQKLKAYNNALGIGNHIPEERAAMTFLIKLCRANYSLFYVTQINEINADASKAPKTVDEVYIKAKAFVVSTTQNKPNGTPVSFATTVDNLIRNNNKKTPKNGPGANPTNNHNSNQPSTANNQPTANVAPTTVEPATANSYAPSATGPNTNRDLSRVQCYHCQLYEHYARECPSKGDGEPLMGMTKGQGYYQPKKYEVGLDTLSQVNVLSSRFLVDIHEGTSISPHGILML